MPERHDAFSNYQEDKAAANIGRDDAPVENVDKMQERFQQHSYEDDREQERLRDENHVERLYQLMKQEGLIDESDEDHKEYGIIQDYIGKGFPTYPEQQGEFFKKIKEIDDRDTAGEWEKTWKFGKEIKKIENREK